MTNLSQPRYMEENQPSNFTFEDTTATRKVFELTKRIRAVAGGTSASKTISILVWLIDYCQSNRNKVVSVVSESYPHLTGGAIRDFKNIMIDRGYWIDKRYVSSPKATYTFETDSIMEFISVDRIGKAHGPRRDILFINETNNLSYNIADQLITRTREIVWLDWNPVIEFWFYTEMLPYRDDIDFITLTYLDNEALDPITKAEIESHKHNKQWWQVYGLGQLGEVEERILRGWTIVDEIPKEARLMRYGLDFGYTNDPTAIDAVHRYNGAFYFDEILHQKGLSNRQIADVLLNIDRALIIADSAEPKSIDEIRSYGLNIIPSKKGKDSVNQGIQYLQDQKIFITKRSVNTIKEYRNYVWLRDRDGNIINEPSPIWNHHMDDIRYAVNSLKATEPRAPQTDFGGVEPLIPGMIS